MKKYASLLFVALMVIGIAACSGKKGCFINGYTSFTQYQKAYLMDLNRNRLDSMNMEEGKFKFQRTGDITEAYALIVCLQETRAPYDYIEMPVFIENGDVTMEIGEYIHTSGTPLNESLQEFFNSLQDNKDAMEKKENVTVAEIESTFSEFYKQQILMNKRNVLGKYIYQEYGANMNAQDREQVKAQMSN